MLAKWVNKAQQQFQVIASRSSNDIQQDNPPTPPKHNTSSPSTASQGAKEVAKKSRKRLQDQTKESTLEAAKHSKDVTSPRSPRFFTKEWLAGHVGLLFTLDDGMWCPMCYANRHDAQVQRAGPHGNPLLYPTKIIAYKLLFDMPRHHIISKLFTYSPSTKIGPTVQGVAVRLVPPPPPCKVPPSQSPPPPRETVTSMFF